MLKLSQINKKYILGKKGGKNFQTTHALKDINLEFRKSEFVSILGPSGCGKTTLLNIIGGLDRYTKGDLFLNGQSTKNFSDRQWDFYRNRFVGFVFQNYNLISHQTVLQNVELALTLSGVGVDERKSRAIEVLKQVGLSDKLYSKPNQLSGGQMQRVAIARALVNNPEIILADEPTGALDSKTSLQIMNLLKEISKERLIIMVTHNPEIAETFSTRIIKMLDGDLISDSNPYKSNENETIKIEISKLKKKNVDLKVENFNSKTNKNKQREQAENQQNKQGESEENQSENQQNEQDNSIIQKKGKFRNKGMSFLTALSLSLKNLLTKKARTFLVSLAGSIGIIGIALILSLSNGFQGYINSVQEDTLSTYPLTIYSTTLDYSTIFDAFLNSGNSETDQIENAVSSNDIIVNMFKSILSKSKSNDLKSFKEFLDENEEIKTFTSAIQYTYNINMTVFSDENKQLNPNSMFYSGILAWLNAFAEKVVYEKLEENFRNGLDDPNRVLTEAEMANLKAQITESAKQMVIAEYIAGLNAQMSGGGFGGEMGGMDMDLESLKNSDLKLWTEMIDNNDLINSQYDIVASSYGAEINGTELLNNMETKDVVLVLDNDGSLSDYTLYALGIKKTPTIEEIAIGLIDSENYEVQPTSFDYDEILGMKHKILLDTDYYLPIGENDTYLDIREAFKDNVISAEEFNSYREDLLENEGFEITIKAILKPKKNVSASSINSPIGYRKSLTEFMIDKQNTAINEKNLDESKKIDIAIPASISIYCIDFEAKKAIENIINEYNESVEETKQIIYTDYINILMSSINMIINSIAFVLIAFVAVSLVVSSIMIGIIINISVLERTKEIGILRSIGASKRDVRRVFTAESLIIGFIAGAFGILVTLILCFPVNLIISDLTGLNNVANLPAVGAVVLLVISMVLTFFAGLFPSRSASKKDPVTALRID